MTTAMATVYNIDEVLKWFFQNPKAFRKVEAECNALVTGPFVRTFFANNKLPKRFKVLVEEQHSDAMRIFLISNGYALHPDSPFVGPDDKQLLTGMSACETYECANGRRVQLLVANTLSAILDPFLRNSMSTGDLNFLTWDKTYVLYPRHTFLEKGTYLLKTNQENGSSPVWRVKMRSFTHADIKVMGLH